MPVFELNPLRRSLIVGAVASVGLMLVGASLADDRASSREDALVSSVGALVADDTLDPRIVALDLEGVVWSDRVATLDAVLFAREDAERRREVSLTALRDTRAELRDVEASLADAEQRASDVDDRIDDHVAALQARALVLFIGHGEEAQLDELESIEDATEGARNRQLAVEVDEHQLGLLAELEAERAALDVELTGLRGRQVSLEAGEAALVLSHDAATADLADANAALPHAIDHVRDARRQAGIPGLDISVVALDAYLTAETTLAETLPACRLEWWMIAGVGRVESRHGEIGGRSINADGRPSRPIIGIALDGRPGIRAIADTDGGALDDDPAWDRAVGPMQFIPETWRIRGRDGDADGVEDPQNIYDAALASATYLCRLGGDLSDGANLGEAYFGYNTSSHYVDLVTTHAERYRTFDLPSIGAETD
ncbi:MAG: lytic transglycosylase domain-containing protein [Actinomycetota bacterium]